MRFFYESYFNLKSIDLSLEPTKLANLMRTTPPPLFALVPFVWLTHFCAIPPAHSSLFLLPQEMETTKKIRRPPNRDLEESSHLTVSTTTPPSPFYLFFLLIISTLWTRHLPHLALSSACATLLAFPFAHFSTILAGLTWISRRTKGRSETVEDVVRRSWAYLLGRNDQSEAGTGRERDDRGRSLVRWTATSCVVSLSLHLWSSRLMIDREVEALDVSAFTYWIGQGSSS